MTTIEELEAEKKGLEQSLNRVNFQIEMAHNERNRAIDASRPPSKWDSLTEAQKNWCHLMAFDPDNPDVPLD